MSAGPRLNDWYRAFAICGAILFGASLAYAGVVYISDFSRSGSPWSWDRARVAISVNALLSAAFVLHHSVFARAGIKRWVTRHVPPSIERSIYVWIASLLFIAMMYGWQAVPGTAWSVSGPAAGLLIAVQFTGAIVAVLAARHIDVAALAGLRWQPTGNAPILKRDGLYGFVRHPIYFAWLLLVWPTPMMTGSRLMFAVLTTAYLIVAIPWEERGLRQEFGAAYDDYRRDVPWRIIWGIY